MKITPDQTFFPDQSCSPPSFRRHRNSGHNDENAGIDRQKPMGGPHSKTYGKMEVDKEKPLQLEETLVNSGKSVLVQLDANKTQPAKDEIAHHTMRPIADGEGLLLQSDVTKVWSTPEGTQAAESQSVLGAGCLKDELLLVPSGDNWEDAKLQTGVISHGDRSDATGGNRTEDEAGTHGAICDTPSVSDLPNMLQGGLSSLMHVPPPTSTRSSFASSSSISVRGPISPPSVTASLEMLGWTNDKGSFKFPIDRGYFDGHYQ